jgi:curved DNA-binding protein
VLQERQLEVTIPRGIREGQHLRLAGQGATGHGGAPAGDLYLVIEILPHPVFRLDGGDLDFDLPVAPWEAALGATVTAPTPGGSVQLNVPPNSPQGRKLRLKGRGLPGKVPGDLYAVVTIALPPSVSDTDKEAYGAFARTFAAYNPRAALEVLNHD